ncbi:MAG: hypothetical protein OXT09_21850 [Myxococcales bacterium]|nr:hypothetical protein [Myxococcales bacterium]
MTGRVGALVALATVAVVGGNVSCGGDIKDDATPTVEPPDPGAMPGSTPGGQPGGDATTPGPAQPGGDTAMPPEPGDDVMPGDDTTTPGDDGSAGDGADDMPTGPVGPIPNPDDPIEQRLRVTDVTIDEGVDGGGSTWGVWGRDDLRVARVFTAPLADCGMLVCTTTASGGQLTPQVFRLDAADQLVETISFTPGLHCRGLAAEPDGHFAVLLWDDDGDRIYLERYDLEGQQSWSTELTNESNTPDSFNIGESRVDYGDGRYGAYYHVHSDDGHEGDTLKWVTASDGTEDTGWSWGCSHSMSNLLRFNPALTEFMSACVTDCFPGTNGDFSSNSIGGIYVNRREKVIDVDAGCNGDAAGELGSAALAPGGWKLVFNAHQAPAGLGQGSYDSGDKNQDIGFSAVGSDGSPGPVVWLTDTPAIDEEDSSIARWQPAGDDAEQYVMGWVEGPRYVLARVDGSGTLLEGPIDVAATAQWGRRDDPFRQGPNSDVLWTWFEQEGSTTLKVARLSAGTGAEGCGTLP